MEAHVLIEMNEYKQLLMIKERFEDAFNDRDAVIFHDVDLRGYCEVHQYKVVSNDTLLSDIAKEVDRLKKAIKILNLENDSLHSKWQKCLNEPKRHWTDILFGNW
jgi:hypothetical protein